MLETSQILRWMIEFVGIVFCTGLEMQPAIYDEILSSLLILLLSAEKEAL